MTPINITIETPKGSNAKYKYDPDSGVFKVKKLLPLGMVFPYAFGFIPGTKGADGDPVDAMIISAEKYSMGCQIEARPVGALLAEQSEKGKKIRNDRYFFIPQDDICFDHIKNLSDFGRRHNEQLRDFFINYNKAEGKIFRPLRIVSASSSIALLKNIIR